MKTLVVRVNKVFATITALLVALFMLVGQAQAQSDLMSQLTSEAAAMKTSVISGQALAITVGLAILAGVILWAGFKRLCR